MDKKKTPPKPQSPEDLKGFEEFIEGHSGDSNFLNRQPGTKKEAGFEHFTFLTNDGERLARLRGLLTEKLPFMTKHEQGVQLINEQTGEIHLIKKKLFELGDKPGSPYRKSLKEIFDSFFEPSQNSKP